MVQVLVILLLGQQLPTSAVVVAVLRKVDRRGLGGLAVVVLGIRVPAALGLLVRRILVVARERAGQPMVLLVDQGS